jgi:citrate synthase
VRSSPSIVPILQKTKHADSTIAPNPLTVSSVLGSLRGVPALLHEGSALDPKTGITYQGYDLPSMLKTLPTETMKTEGSLWLLLTGTMPTEKDTKGLSELFGRSEVMSLDEEVKRAIDS